MAAIARAIKRIFTAPKRRHPRSAAGHFRILKREGEIPNAALLLSHYGDRSVVMTRKLLTGLWDLDTTALYVQLDRATSPADLVFTRHTGHLLIATGHGFRAETQTHEPTSNGAYLVQREYRQLGLYETPPPERAIVVLRITAGSGPTYLVEVPPGFSHVTVVANRCVIAQEAPIPSRGQVRYHVEALRD